jgi:hypothetical protein
MVEQHEPHALKTADELRCYGRVISSCSTSGIPRVTPIQDTTDTVRSASYLDLHLEIDNEGR